MTYNAERFTAKMQAHTPTWAKLLVLQTAVAAVERCAAVNSTGYGFDRDYDIVTLWPMVRLRKSRRSTNEMLLNYIVASTCWFAEVVLNLEPC